MTNTRYTNARDATVALNRLRRPSVRLRSGEKKSHLEQDHALARALWHDPNILGYGVGHKVPDDPGSDICLVFFVRKRLPKFRLRHLVAVPKHLALNTLGTRVRTDVQEWGGLPVSHGQLSSGDSIGDVSGNSGTMTLAVRDSATGTPLILSCSHVLARCGAGQAGDSVESPASAASPSILGQLVRFTEINRRSTRNQVDAAVAQPNDDVTLSNGTIAGIRDLTLIGNFAVGVQVQRSGQATGSQGGQIKNIHVATSIVYPQMDGDPSVNFIELVQYDSVSEEGDSGAAVLDTGDSPNVVGLHIAGSSDGTLSLFTHIRFVFDALNIAL